MPSNINGWFIHFIIFFICSIINIMIINTHKTPERSLSILSYRSMWFTLGITWAKQYPASQLLPFDPSSTTKEYTKMTFTMHLWREIIYVCYTFEANLFALFNVNHSTVKVFRKKLCWPKRTHHNISIQVYPSSHLSSDYFCKYIYTTCILKVTLSEKTISHEYPISSFRTSKVRDKIRGNRSERTVSKFLYSAWLWRFFEGKKSWLIFILEKRNWILVSPEKRDCETSKPRDNREQHVVGFVTDLCPWFSENRKDTKKKVLYRCSNPNLM